MTAFHYNQPTMTGISICCDPIPLCFHVHCKGDEDLSFYGTGPTRSTWLYIPFAKGEKITAIWMRERDGNDIEIAMLFETSWERKIVVGAQDENLARRSWYKIDSPRGKEAMFYFDSYGAAGRELVFMSPEPLLEEQLDEPVVQQPTTPCPLGSDAEYFMLSSASLENVSSMRPCHQERDRHAKITGMELRYMDGSATALGEVRLDCMGPRVAIFDSPMWLIFRRDSDGNPYLASIEFAEPEDQRHCFHYNYMQVAWSGDIEWWFSDKLCRVWIDDSTSLLSVYETFTWGL